VRVYAKGPFAGQARVRVLCKRGAAARCEGTVKVRTVRRINERLRGGTRLRRVTLGTGTYQLPRGRVGYAKVVLSPRALALVRRRGPFAVHALVTVLDERGRQQTLRRTFRIRAS
jgi:hypothetical protein